MNLNELRDRAYKTACEHGWHEEEHSDEHFLCLVISELMEAVEADRKGKHSDVAKFKEWQWNSIPLTEETRLRRFKEDFEAYIKGTVEEELADACIRLFDLAGIRNIDLSDTNEIADELVSLKSDLKLTEVCFGFTSALTIDGESLGRRICGTLAGLIKYCQFSDIDLMWHIEQKMCYNELRDYKHGNKKY